MTFFRLRRHNAIESRCRLTFWPTLPEVLTTVSHLKHIATKHQPASIVQHGRIAWLQEIVINLRVILFTNVAHTDFAVSTHKELHMTT